MDITTEQNSFVLDQKAVDSLRLEMSSLPPTKEKQLRNLCLQVVNTIKDSYGPFMSNDNLPQLDTIPNRIIITDRENLKNFPENWLPEKTNQGGSDPTGFTTPSGNIVVVAYSPDFIWNLCPDNYKRTFTQYMGDRAKEGLGLGYLVHNLTHEILHQFHMNRKSRVDSSFYEGGTEYYQTEIMRKLGFGAFNDIFVDVPHRILLNFYTALLQQYGKRPHRIFFGSEPL